MDAPTTSQTTLPTTSLHSTADPLQAAPLRHDSSHNSPPHNVGSSPLELSEAEMGLNLLKKQAELVRLEIQQLELELAIHQARHGNREPLANWQKKHGTPWSQLVESHSATRYPNQTSPQHPCTPQPESLFVQPHNATISAIQQSPIQANQIQASRGQNQTGSSPAGQGSVQPVIYSLLSNFSPSITSAHANFANHSIVLRHPLSPGQHSHPSTYPIETAPTNLVLQPNNLHQGPCNSQPSLAPSSCSAPVSYGAIACQLHSHQNTPPTETACENRTESFGAPLRITESPFRPSQQFSSPPLFPSPAHRSDQTLHSLSKQPNSPSTQPNETNPKVSSTSTSTQVFETHLPQSLNSPKPKGDESQLPSISTSASPACEKTSQTPQDDHPATDSSDAISLIRPQAIGTKTDSPKDTEALLSPTLSSQSQPSQTQASPTQASPAQPAIKSPTATSPQEPAAKPKTTRPNKNQSSRKKSPPKPSSSATSPRLASLSNQPH